MLLYDIFIRAHYLFRLLANGFPKAKLEENCELRATDNVQRFVITYENVIGEFKASSLPRRRNLKTQLFLRLGLPSILIGTFRILDGDGEDDA